MEKKWESEGLRLSAAARSRDLPQLEHLPLPDFASVGHHLPASPTFGGPALAVRGDHRDLAVGETADLEALPWADLIAVRNDRAAAAALGAHVLPVGRRHRDQ